MNIEYIVILVVCGIAAAVLMAGLKSNDASTRKLRQQADLQFKQTKIEAPNHGVMFDGSVAQVVKEQESHYLAGFSSSNYVLTREALMPDGQLYLFKSSASGRPYVACISRGSGHGVVVSVPARRDA